MRCRIQAKVGLPQRYRLTAICKHHVRRAVQAGGDCFVQSHLTSEISAYRATPPLPPCSCNPSRTAQSATRLQIASRRRFRWRYWATSRRRGCGGLLSAPN
eukprot:scaffold8867_cov118-Isochrysis_galbana.AAC.11